MIHISVSLLLTELGDLSEIQAIWAYTDASAACSRGWHLALLSSRGTATGRLWWHSPPNYHSAPPQSESSLTEPTNRHFFKRARLKAAAQEWHWKCLGGGLAVLHHLQKTTLLWPDISAEPPSPVGARLMSFLLPSLLPTTTAPSDEGRLLLGAEFCFKWTLPAVRPVFSSSHFKLL